ncbi:phosphatase [Arthrobacter sp. MYb227]|nr:phosphatase [Arthrobacter sp. MYb227]
MDGTLVDSTAAVESLWTEFAVEYGLDIAELLDFSHGRQTLDTLRRFLPHGPKELAALAAGLEAQEITNTEGIVEVPGAATFLESLGQTPYAVVTSAGRALAISRLRAAGLPVPEVLIAAEDVLAGKPSPEGYLLAASALGVDISDCAVFEDAPAGLQAAVISGAQTIVVGTYESTLTRSLARIGDYTQLSFEHGLLHGHKGS